MLHEGSFGTCITPVERLGASKPNGVLAALFFHYWRFWSDNVLDRSDILATVSSFG
jgi:hypothetical protein